MPTRRVVSLLVLALVLLYPLLDTRLGLGNLPSLIEVWIYVLLTLGLNVVVGFGGLLNLGYAAFFSLGCFTMAHLTSPQSPLRECHLAACNFWVALLASCLLAAAAGALLALPTLRLRGDYLAIVTMGFGLMLPPLLIHFGPYTLATTGLAGIASPSIGSLTLDSNPAWYYLMLCAVALVTLCINRLRQSRHGRALKALREDELAAASCGIDLIHIKLLAFTVGAGIAGLGGGLYAARLGTLSWSFPQDFNGSIMFLAMCILGGLGSIQGSILGATMIGLFNKIVTPILASNVPGLEHAQFLLFGLTLVLMMRLKPQGLLPEETHLFVASEEPEHAAPAS
jgi:branched-chain amino acid transport system permease protein